jgi:hypothetical protein
MVSGKLDLSLSDNWHKRDLDDARVTAVVW